jgi:hypothetical protein
MELNRKKSDLTGRRAFLLSSERVRNNFLFPASGAAGQRPLHAAK